MIFQIIDDKRECRGYFADGRMRFRDLPNTLESTWDWSEMIGDRDIKFAKIISGGKTIHNACPEHLKERLERREGKIRAHLKSFVSSKVKLSDVCFYKLIPEKDIQHYYSLLNEITEWVIENNQKPQNYRLMHNINIMCKELSQQEIRVDKGRWKWHAERDQKAMYLSKRFWDKQLKVDYNPWGTITGRLGLNEGSFPILNLKTSIKDIIKPKWDCFVELDFNGAELRTLLNLSGHQQPTGDIHDWNQTNIFNNSIERAAAKKKIFAWLYNPNSTDVDTDYYDKSKVLEKYYAEGIVSTPFGRTIPSDDFHALNYLVQSTSSDNFLDRACTIHRYCKGLKTNVAFLVHDSIVLDVPFEEKARIREIVKIFENTKLGKFKVNLKIGENLGVLR
jgi:hypothetical protein